MPFIGLKTHLISALEKKEKEKGTDAPKKKKEARRCTENKEENHKPDTNQIFASQDHVDGEWDGTSLAKVKLLQKDPKRMGEQVDLKMMKKKKQNKI